jgi:hypothetical protein
LAKILSKASLTVLWGYAVELILAICLSVLIWLIWDKPTIDHFFELTISDWLTVTSQVLFPAGVAIWITYVNLETTEFGDYLNHAGVEKAYSAAFVLPSAVFFLTSTVMIAYKGSSIAMLSYASVFLLTYSLAMVFSLISNTAAVIRLYRRFKIEIERERRKEMDKKR